MDHPSATPLPFPSGAPRPRVAPRAEAEGERWKIIEISPETTPPPGGYVELVLDDEPAEVKPATPRVTVTAAAATSPRAPVAPDRVASAWTPPALQVAPTLALLAAGFAALCAVVIAFGPRIAPPAAAALPSPPPPALPDRPAAERRAPSRPERRAVPGPAGATAPRPVKAPELLGEPPTPAPSAAAPAQDQEQELASAVQPPPVALVRAGVDALRRARLADPDCIGAAVRARPGLAARLPSAARVEVQIGANGAVAAATIVSSAPDEAVVAALREVVTGCAFVPQLDGDGLPVPASLVLDVEFVAR